MKATERQYQRLVLAHHATHGLALWWEANKDSDEVDHLLILKQIDLIEVLTDAIYETLMEIDTDHFEPDPEYDRELREEMK